MFEDLKEIEKTLITIQNDLDDAYIEYTKKDFDLKLNHHTSIQDKLLERDTLIRSSGTLNNFWELAFINYEMGVEVLPQDKENKIRADFIDFIRVWYEKDYECCVEILVKDNPFIENKKLFKKFNISNGESVGTKIEWKEEIEGPLFYFFENEEENLQIFDILYELYVNGVFYYSSTEDSEST